MAEAVKTYDPKAVTIRLGPYLINGFSDGTFIKVTRATENFRTVIGAGGEAVRVKTNDRSGTIEITLLQSSSSNDDLQALLIADEKSNSGVVPFFLKDDSGRTLAEAVSVWVNKQPDIERGKDQVNVTWTLSTNDVSLYLGGH